MKRLKANSILQTLGVVSCAFACVALGCSEPADSGDGGSGGISGAAGSGAPTGGVATGGSSVGGTGGSGAPTGGVATGGTGVVGGAGQSGSGGMAAGAGGAGSGGTVSGGAGSGGTAGMTTGGSGGGGASNGGAGSGGRAGNGGGGGAAGGGAGGTAGSGGGATGFSPCPATGACKILPLGDSITDGVGVSGGGSYRIELFHLALQAQQEITYVGSLSNGPQMVDMQTFPRDHEGHSGWTISQIDGITPSYALDDDPHIILLHIGTNDMRGDVSMAGNRLGTLIDQIVMDQPNALLVVAKIIPYPAQSNQVTTYNNAVPGVVQMRASAGKHVVLVDQFTGFPNGELADGIHPNAAGYRRMAGVWYAAISQYLH